MEAMLRDVHRGEMSFDMFAEATRSRWQKMARYLLRRWSTTGVDEDDLVQELLIGAWLYLDRWDAGRGNAERFIVWQAMTRAKAWLHCQRGAGGGGNGRRDRSPSRCEVLLGDDNLDELLEVEAAQEYIVGVLERLRLACKLMPTKESERRLATVAVTGSIDAAQCMMRQQTGSAASRPVFQRTLRMAAALLEE